MNGWKTINTAPKYEFKDVKRNEPLLLVRKDTGKVTVGEYWGPYASNYPNHEWADLLDISNLSDDGYCFERIEAAYWMPFPDPPKE